MTDDQIQELSRLSELIDRCDFYDKYNCYFGYFNGVDIKRDLIPKLLEEDLTTLIQRGGYSDDQFLAAVTMNELVKISSKLSLLDWLKIVQEFKLSAMSANASSGPRSVHVFAHLINFTAYVYFDRNAMGYSDREARDMILTILRVGFDIFFDASIISGITQSRLFTVIVLNGRNLNIPVDLAIKLLDERNRYLEREISPQQALEVTKVYNFNFEGVSLNYMSSHPEAGNVSRRHNDAAIERDAFRKGGSLYNIFYLDSLDSE